MLTVSFPISLKENEKRRALLPESLKNIIHKEKIFIEEGYGEVFGIEDREYSDLGVNVVSRNQIFDYDIICDPKIGDAEYFDKIKGEKTYFGWFHAVQNKELTDFLIKSNSTAIAWEDMSEGKRHSFWRNNELAGEAAILHAFTLYTKMPYDCKVAVIGNGNTARGAYKALVSLGAEVTLYDRKTVELLKNEIHQYDVVVNAVLWDITRNDHIIYKKDLESMKRNSMIIDVSCDREGAIESSKPTSIENPIYYENSVLHYVVDHTPALVSFTASRELSKVVSENIDKLIEKKYINDPILSGALIVEQGKVLDEKIIKYQKRRNLEEN